MKRSRHTLPYDTYAVVHDHFEGSAHCVECGGDCKLTGTEMAYTALMRWLFDGEANGSIMSHNALGQIARSGVDIEKFRTRARDQRDALAIALRERTL